MPRVTRRMTLLAGAALPLAATLPARPARAELQGPGQGAFKRFGLGDWEVTTLLVGARRMEDPRATFAMTTPEADFAAAAEANFLPADHSWNSFTPVLVNTGADLVLFDTGLAAEPLLMALAEAGVQPESVTVVVLTHMHGDHIGGLTGETGSPTFANARYVTGRIEYDHWAAAANEGFDAKVRPLADKMTFLQDGEAALPGITALAAFGHTPGHMAYVLESAGQKLVLTADTANHFAFSLGHPDWEVRFDTDKPAAAATRKRIFGMIAEERLPFIGYHMPFPALGYVEVAGDGFRYVPASYQLAF